MSVDRIYLQRSARNIEESPSYVPYSKVRIIVGEEEDGTQLVYEAGDDSFRTLEITNPYGTQEIANSILSKIQGFSYKPFTADGAILNPAAELGDAVNVGEVYSFIANMDTTFSPLMSATISAPEDSNIDHEYPYESSESKEIARKINGAKASFIVEIGRIEASLEDYQRKEDMDGYVEERTLNASIGAYIDSAAGTAKVISAASGTYQRKDQMGNYVLQSSLNTSIGQYIDTQAGTAKIIAAASGTYQRKDAMSGYVTTSSLNTSIGQYIDTQTGQAKIVAACSGTYQTQAGMSNYVLQSSLNTSIGQYIDSRAGTAKIESVISATYQTKAGMSAYVQSSQLNNSITQYVNSTTGKNSIVASVSGSFAGKSYESRVEVSESKIGWLIKSGTSASNFTMTDRAIQLTAGSIDLTGYVTFNSLTNQGATSINGSNITTGTISADRINASSLKIERIYSPNTDNAIIYCEKYGSIYDQLHIGSDRTYAQIKYINIQATNEVTIGYYDGMNSIVFDTATKVAYPSTGNGWKLGKTNRAFAEIVVNKITFAPNNTGDSYANSLTASGSGTTVTLTPNRDKTLNIGTSSYRLGEVYLDIAQFGSSGASAKIGFFGTTPIAKQTLSTSSANMGYTSATSSNYLVILNNVVGILSKKYGMFAS